MYGYREVRGCGHVWIQRGKRVLMEETVSLSKAL